MVDRAERCTHSPTNEPYLTDHIEIFLVPQKVDKEFISRKYRESNLTISQIANEIGLSRVAITERLDKAGVSKRTPRGRALDNFCAHNPPYGFSVLNNRLVPNRKQMSTIRLIVELRDRQGLTWTRIATELNAKGIKNRRGVGWHHFSVSRIHKCWSGKL